MTNEFMTFFSAYLLKIIKAYRAPITHSITNNIHIILDNAVYNSISNNIIHVILDNTV